MQEWYLLTSDTRPNATGGYENDAFLDYKEDAFQEALQTDIATTVTLYNYDLSESKQMRCVIQSNTADTQLKSLERTVLASIGTLKAGMYIYFENRYWLITGYPGNNKIYEKATMILCQYKLRWQDDTGKIIERWANFTSASKYDTGRSGNQTIVLTSNNFTIWIPEDDDSATLDARRVFIDRDTNHPTKVFEITRSDDVLYLFGEDHGGILSFIADKDELNLEVDRPDLGLCDYKPPRPLPPKPDETTDLSAVISGNNKLKCGFDRDYMVEFIDSKGEIHNDTTFSWNVISDFEVTQTITGNTITLFVDDEDCIGSSFLLQVIVNQKVFAEITIDVIEAF